MSGETARHDPRSGARTVARKLAMQALYRLQLNDGPWQDLLAEFDIDVDLPRADQDYFREIVQSVATTRESLDAQLAPWLDRKPTDLDPVEHAVLLIAVWELNSRPDVPYRVVINEAVSLARRFGSTDGHKFVNAVVDRAARELRAREG